MKYLYALLLLVSLFFGANAQPILSTGTLPDVGDKFEYQNFEFFPDSLSYKMNGENLSWSYSGFDLTDEYELEFVDIEGNPLKDSIEGGQMIIDIGGFENVARKTSNSIEIIGLLGLDFGFVSEDVIKIENPFRYIDRPMEYGDKYEDSFAIPIQFAASMIPGLDTIELPLPGATLDSLRFSTIIYKSEEATAWGTLELNGTSYDVLKIEQIDSSSTLIEAGLNVFGTVVWFDASAFIGDMGGGGAPGGVPGGFGMAGRDTTYKFHTPTNKQSILEFTEEVERDTLGNIIDVNVIGRLGVGMINSLDDSNEIPDDFTIYPNPVSDFIIIKGPEDEISLDIQILNLNGKLIHTESSYKKGQQINIAHLSAGTYFVEIRNSDNKVKTLSFVK